MLFLIMHCFLFWLVLFGVFVFFVVLVLVVAFDFTLLLGCSLFIVRGVFVGVSLFLFIMLLFLDSLLYFVASY